MCCRLVVNSSSARKGSITFLPIHNPHILQHAHRCSVEFLSGNCKVKTCVYISLFIKRESVTSNIKYLLADCNGGVDSQLLIIVVIEAFVYAST